MICKIQYDQISINLRKNLPAKFQTIMEDCYKCNRTCSSPDKIQGCVQCYDFTRRMCCARCATEMKVTENYKDIFGNRTRSYKKLMSFCSRQCVESFCS